MYSGRLDRRSTAGSARSTSRGRRRIRSISTCARAATRACARARSTRSTRATRSTSIAARIIARASSRAAPSARSTSRAQDTRARRTLRPRARPARDAVVHAAPAAAGLFRARAPTSVAQAKAVTEIATLTGEFEKPKFFNYKASLCAHSRSRKTGCTQCIDVCSALAIRPDGDRIAVEPHLCVGCGACTTVCPSGALTYAYPAVPDLARADQDAAVDVREGGRTRRVPPAARRGRPRGDRAAGAPRQGAAGARHPAGDAPHRVRGPRRLARGARVGRLAGRRADDRQRSAAVSRCARVPDAARRHDRQCARLPGRAFPAGRRRRRARRAVRNGRPRSARASPRRSRPTPEKRTTAALRARASRRARADSAAGDSVAGRRAVRRHRDQPRHVHDVPRLRRARAPRPRSSTTSKRRRCASSRAKCVQCGICAATCPGARDHAGAAPRSHAGAPRRRACSTKRPSSTASRCGKPLGTQKMIETMLGKLAGHSMFAAPGRARPAQDVRRLPGGRPHQEREERRHPQSLTQLEPVPITLQQPIAPEDQARAEFYALLARLFAGAPGRAAARGARRVGAVARRRRQSARRRRGTASSSRAGPWTPRRRSRSTPTSSSASGAARCDLHASHWIAEATAERPLVGRARRPGAAGARAPRGGSTLYEDHLAALCETMRILIAGDRRPRAGVDCRRSARFSTRRIAPWVYRLLQCNIAKCTLLITTVRVAQFTSLFMAVERDSFAID